MSDDYVGPDDPGRRAYLDAKFAGRCATCRHWSGGYIDDQRTRLLEKGWCGRLGDEPLRVIGPGSDGVQIVTRHDFGCTEWEKRQD